MLPTFPRRLRRVGPVLLFSAYLLLAGFYLAIIPPLEGPDEDAHLGYVAYLRATPHLPPLDRATAARSHQLIQQPPLIYVLTALLTLPVSPQAALDAAELNPYLQKGLSVRAYLIPPDVPPGSLVGLYLARGVSLLGGLLAVLGTWQLARRLLPREGWAAYLAAALVGFNPQFLFSSATFTNDTWAAALAVWTLWLGVGAAAATRTGDRRTLRLWAGTGALLGAALLTKVSAAAVAVPLVLVWGLAWWRGPRRQVLLGAGAALLGLTLVGGWWLARNLWLTGELIPLTAMTQLIPGMARPARLAWDAPEVWRGVRWLLRSYWGVYGYGIIAPAAYHGIIQNLLLAALLGCGVLAVRGSWDRAFRPWPALAVILIWCATALLSLINWMRLMRYTDQGRLLFPAAGGFALLIALGLGAWLPRRLRPWGAALVIMGMVALAGWQGSFLRARYAEPEPLPAPVVAQRPLQVRFDGGMTLLGVDLPAGAAVGPGEALPLVLYWTTETVIAENYTLFLHLAGADNQLLYQFDGVPFGGRHPTRQWRPGDIFADPYTILLPPGSGDMSLPAADRLATLSVGFYPVENPGARRQAVALADGAPIGDRVVAARVRLTTPRAHAPSPAPGTPPVATWANGIELAQVEVITDAAGVPVGARLRWQTSQTIHQDYTLFIQLLDGQNQVLAQRDQLPLGGAAPTGTWRAGDTFDDEVELTPRAADAAQDWQRLVVGWYGTDGVRLGVTAPEPGDAVVVRVR